MVPLARSHWARTLQPPPMSACWPRTRIRTVPRSVAGRTQWSFSGGKEGGGGEFLLIASDLSISNPFGEVPAFDLAPAHRQGLIFLRCEGEREDGILVLAEHAQALAVSGVPVGNDADVFFV